MSAQLKPMPRKAAHKDNAPGRHCWLCGRLGGAGFKAAFVAWGYDVPDGMVHAHPECVAKFARKQKA